MKKNTWFLVKVKISSCTWKQRKISRLAASITRSSLTRLVHRILTIHPAWNRTCPRHKTPLKDQIRVAKFLADSEPHLKVELLDGCLKMKAKIRQVKVNLKLTTQRMERMRSTFKRLVSKKMPCTTLNWPNNCQLRSSNSCQTKKNQIQNKSKKVPLTFTATKMLQQLQVSVSCQLEAVKDRRLWELIILVSRNRHRA